MARYLINYSDKIGAVHVITLDSEAAMNADLAHTYLTTLGVPVHAIVGVIDVAIPANGDAPLPGDDTDAQRVVDPYQTEPHVRRERDVRSERQIPGRIGNGIPLWGIGIALSMLILAVAALAWYGIVSQSRSVASSTAHGSTTSTSTPATSASRDFDPADLFNFPRIDTGTCAYDNVCELSSPSGNFDCYMRPGVVSCAAPAGEAVVDGVTVADGRDPSTRVPPTAIRVDSNGQTEIFAGHGNGQVKTREQLYPYRFPYGHQMSVFGFTCAMDATTGVSCRNDATGHGFTVTRQSYHLF